MEEFVEGLHRHMDAVDAVCDKIEAGEAYTDSMAECLQPMEQAVTAVLGLLQDMQVPAWMDAGYVLQVLGDVLYGMEQGDDVFLLDALRYGLLEIYRSIEAGLQSGGHDEQTSI